MGDSFAGSAPPEESPAPRFLIATYAPVTLRGFVPYSRADIGPSIEFMGVTLSSAQVGSFLVLARRAAAKVSQDDEVIGEAADHAIVQLARCWEHVADNDRARRKWVQVVAANHARRVGRMLHRELPVGRAGSEPPPLYDERDNERIADLINELNGPNQRFSSQIAMKVDFQQRWTLLSVDDRSLLKMKYVLGMTSKEIAAKRGRREAPGTIDNKLTKAKKAARFVFDDLLDELKAHPAPPQSSRAAMTSPHHVLELSEQSRGRWLVETESGSRHLFDLDESTYARRSSNRKLRSGLDNGQPHRIIEIEQWPRVNARFTVTIDTARTETTVSSSYVTCIAPLAPGEVLSVDLPELSLLEEVAQAPPTNAWLLIADDAAFPTADELREQRDPLDPQTVDWTCPRQIMRGDLVFIYFIAPRKAIHFVARAVTAPVYDPEAMVNAKQEIDLHQWWTEITPPVEVPPVPYQDLARLHDGQLILKGKPRHYLTPTIVDQLIASFGDLNDEQRLVLQTPTGDPELPAPEAMTLDDLRRLAGGRLRVEAEVERYIVDPLLRLCFPPSGPVTHRPRPRLPGAGIADYGIYQEGKLCGVIEVKLGVRRRRNGDLRGSPDVQQAVRYAKAVDTAAVLIDANTIFLIDRNADAPARSFDRQRLTTQHVTEIAALLTGASTS